MSRVFQVVREKKKAVAIAAVGLVALAGGGTFFFKMKAKKATEHPSEVASEEHHATEYKHAAAEEHHATEDKHAEPSRHVASVPASTGFFGRFWQAMENVQDNVEELRRLDIENQRLKLENAQLRLRSESANFECSVAKSRQLTEDYAAQVQKSSGNRIGRTLASISYQPPTHLLPIQLHALGLSQFRAGEYEKAAKIFTLLSEMSKEEAFQSVSHKMLTGVAWYRLKNWDMAESYFDQILSQTSPEAGEPKDSDLKFFAQARLWKALLAHQRGQKAKAQSWMSELVEHHPRSPEAGWINIHHEAGGHRVRVPASHQ